MELDRRTRAESSRQWVSSQCSRLGGDDAESVPSGIGQLLLATRRSPGMSAAENTRCWL
jgi:hypothetical protein